RFVNRDVVAGAIDYAQTLNRYDYVNGNPISYVDPFGLERIKSTYVAANPRYVAYNSVYKPQAPSLSVFRGLWNDLGEYGERKAREKDRGMSKDEALFILQLIGGPKGGGVKSGGGAKGAGKVIPEVSELGSNRIHHILQDKHAWDRVVKDKNNWNEISNIISIVRKNGTESAYKKSARMKSMKVNGQIVEVTFVRLKDGTIKISDAWVRTK
ncbi:polymorphic toxin type 35 domain-containing protein, partial [Aneurinibacillus aneurinilyticus]|uniref:polymorphic toxin type 35 domain-containing protein n=1 Tax=Aneurinibacillus aneurinilyticus TaxID=1391 RepID=UPI00352352AE